MLVALGDAGALWSYEEDVPRANAAPKPRRAEGGAYPSRGKWYARVTVAPNKREGVLLPWARPEDEAPAQDRGRALQAMVSRLREAGEESWIGKVLELGGPADAAKLAELESAVDGIVAGKIVRAVDPNVTTFGAFAMQWVRGELAERYPDHVTRKRSAYTDLCYLQRYIFPVVGSKAVGDVTLEDYEQVMAEIPRRCLRTQRRGARPRRPDEEKRARDAGEQRKIKPATRRHVAQCMRRVMQLAEYPAKLVARNPIPPNALPKVRTVVALQFLYPDEDAALMRFEAIDLGHRILYGFLARMGWRKEEALGGTLDEVDDAVKGGAELEAIPPATWSRFDLRRGVVNIDRDKTGEPRPIPLDPGVCRTLKAWREMHPNAKPTDPVFVDMSGKPIATAGLAETFREAHLRPALQAADMDRLELYERSAVRQPLRLHDLRASFVTIAFANRRDERWVRDRTGHRSGALERYRRVARTVEELELGDWSPLDEVIPEVCRRVHGGKRGGNSGETEGSTEQILNDSAWGDRRVLNPRHLEPQAVTTRTDTTFRDVRTPKEDLRGPSGTLPPRFAAASGDGVESALAEAIGALSEAMRRAPPEAVAALGEAMRVALGELAARRGR